MRFSELHFGYNKRTEYNDSLQAVGFLKDGRWFSVMQTAYDIEGRPRITYDVMVDGWQDTARWLSPSEVEDLLNNPLEPEPKQNGE